MFSGQYNTGTGPEFGSEEYKNHGTYIIDFVDLKDIIEGKINLVPSLIKEKLVSDLNKFKNISKLSSRCLINY